MRRRQRVFPTRDLTLVNRVLGALAFSIELKRFQRAVWRQKTRGIRLGQARFCRVRLFLGMKDLSIELGCGDSLLRIGEARHREKDEGQRCNSEHWTPETDTSYS